MTDEQFIQLMLELKKIKNKMWDGIDVVITAMVIYCLIKGCNGL